MVTKFGMSEKVGLINYDDDSDEVFIGRDLAHASRGYGENVAGVIDQEVKRIIDECYAKRRALFMSTIMYFMRVQNCFWKKKRFPEKSLNRCLEMKHR